MSPFKEACPEGAAKYEEKVKQWYQEILKDLCRNGFEPTPAEAVFLRQTIRECFDENDRTEQWEKETGKESMDYLWTYPEIFERFFLHYYGVNVSEYLRGINPEYQQQAKKDLYRYVQEKLRKDRELI
jgi:hypothetical protein